ncbi:hypothetical protein [Xenorhabdus sp. KK7.4]|uniref:hypothetical protein n=1 Tax=Xenorhabdus TaxID=626 RepID=UPI000C050E37|nr:hypothetical protein [Xenorhabdus sp. KK7.4]PHM53871.1 hypothetical protein Xekk_02782 [Xenorhabdus sp. KK7.4]
MKYTNPLMIIVFLITWSISSAYAGCPDGKNGTYTGYVGKIIYNAKDEHPTFTLSNYPDSIMSLSKEVGINTPRGKNISDLLILAKFNFNKITVTCTDLNVSTLTLEDNNDPENK